MIPCRSRATHPTEKDAPVPETCHAKGRLLTNGPPWRRFDRLDRTRQAGQTEDSPVHSIAECLPALGRRRSRYLPFDQPHTGTTSPSGSAFPSFILKENALELATLSHADLVAELLSPPSAARSADTYRVNDAEPTYGMTSPDNSVLDHKLGVARELLLRELKAQMCRGPVMDSPRAIRDWLRLYCAGLEHEVFLVLY